MTIAMTISTLAVLGTPINAADVTTPDNELLAHVNNIANGAQDVEAVRFIEGSTPTTPASTKWKLYFKTTGPYILEDTGSESALALGSAPQACCARLTLTSGLAVTVSDVTAATNVYVTPYGGNRIALYSGSVWANYTFTQITISLAAFVADKNYDVFVYDNGSGTVIAETVVWTNDSTRATALVLQDGVYVKSGTTTKRYIGTFRTTATIGQCEDSISKRYVWNYYNRVVRDMAVTEATDSWTYATATWRPWNNLSTNRASFVIGVAETVVRMDFLAFASQAGSVLAYAGIGIDSTTLNSGISMRHGAATAQASQAAYQGKPAAGYHFLQLLEYASGATVTYFGDAGGTLIQSGAYAQMAA